MDATYCKDCGRELDEPSDLLPEDREPCPECGSTARRFTRQLEATLAATSSLEARATVIRSANAMLVGEGHLEATPEVEHAIETIATVAFRLEWLEPSDEESSYTVMVYDAADQLIEMAEAANAEDALLTVAEKLVPPETGEHSA